MALTKTAHYHVTDWQTRRVLSHHIAFAEAKRVCRSHGFEPCKLSTLGQAPVAYVADDNGLLIYNPRYGSNT